MWFLHISGNVVGVGFLIDHQHCHFSVLNIRKEKPTLRFTNLKLMVLWFIKLPPWSSSAAIPWCCSHTLIPALAAKSPLATSIGPLSIEGMVVLAEEQECPPNINPSDWWGNIWDSNTQTHRWHQLPSYWILTLWKICPYRQLWKDHWCGGKEYLARWTRVAQRLSRPSKSPWKCPACILFSCQVYTARGCSWLLYSWGSL